MNLTYSTSLSFLALLLITLSNIQPGFGQCQSHHPFDKVARHVPCQYVTSDRVSARSIHRRRNQNMFELSSFTCDSNNQTVCDAARRSFVKTGEIISSVLKLNTPIKINAKFIDFCKNFNFCGKDRPIGSATMTRSILMLDDDGVERYYGQALVKQFEYPIHREYDPHDINAFFSKDADWYFEGDSEIKPKQIDFLVAVLHETIHGLGFLSSWSPLLDTQYLNRTTIETLTPALELDIKKDKVTFKGFREFAYDKYMLRNTNGERFSLNLAKKMNRFTGGKPKTYSNVKEFLNDWEKSKEYSFSVEMLKDAVTPKVIGFLPHDTTDPKESILLETSLDPFVYGSNLNHLDIKFQNTSDFLFIWKGPRGSTLDELVEKFKSDGPIGPMTIKVLETLGYATRHHPNPYKPRLPNKVTVLPNN